MEIQIYDTLEEIILAIQTVLRNNFNTENSTIFSNLVSSDLLEFGEAIPIPTIDNNNVKLGSLESLLLDQGEYPCILIDCTGEKFNTKGSHTIMGGKHYNIEIVICNTHDHSEYLDRINIRTAQALLQVMMKNCYLSGKCNGMSCIDIQYSSPIGLPTGWFRASAHNWRVLGITE